MIVFESWQTFGEHHWCLFCSASFICKQNFFPPPDQPRRLSAMLNVVTPFGGRRALPRMMGQRHCVSAEDCCGNVTSALVQHLYLGDLADIYCVDCWASFKLRNPSLECVDFVAPSQQQSLENSSSATAIGRSAAEGDEEGEREEEERVAATIATPPGNLRRRRKAKKSTESEIVSMKKLLLTLWIKKTIFSKSKKTIFSRSKKTISSKSEKKIT